MLLQTFHSFTQHAMGPAALVTLHASILLFLIAAIISVIALLQPRKVRMAWADWTGAAGAFCLGAYFIARFTEAGSEPFTNLFEVIELAGLCLVLAYFIATRMRKLPALGAFAFPAVAIIFIVNLAFADSAAQGHESTPLLVIHVLLTLLSYGAFFMASLAAVMFLVLERALKKHQDPTLIRSFPPLESLKRLVDTCILVGLPLLSLGLVLGFIALSPSGWESIVRNPKIPPSLVLWAVLLLVAAGRWLGFLRGRRNFYMVLLGFALVVMTFVGLGVWSRSNSRVQTAAVVGKVSCIGT